MAVLTAKKRDKLPAKSFALPGGRYPIHDKGHAQAALARVKQHGTPEEKKKVFAKVQSRFGIGGGAAAASGQDDAILGATSGRRGGHAGRGL
jgi:hypothetical protein